MKPDPKHIASEEYLVARCRQGDAQAQKTLYLQHATAMMLVCVTYIPGKEDAREALMDGFLDFFNGMGSFVWRGEGSVKAWLKRIVINRCLMQLRTRNAFAPAAQELELYNELPGDTAADDGLAAKELLALVHSLPDGYRAVFNLYALEGMSHKEIGILLGISEQTSRSQFSRARALLREKLAYNKHNYL